MPPMPSSDTSKRAVGAASLAFAMLGTAHVAVAGDTAPAPLSTQDQDTTEVVVKGQRDIDTPKRPTPLRDTPKSITVIPQELIQSTGSTTLVDALRTVPGITFGAGEGGNPVGDRPFLRGYDTQSSTFVDGLRDIGAQSREVFDVESIEVVKGTSGAYAGRGGAGGGIYINSKEPEKDNFTSGQVGLGTADYKRATLDINHVLADGVAGRLNLMVHDAGVDGRDAVHYSRWGFAPSVTFGMGTNNRFTLSYYHMQSDDMPDVGIPYNNPNAPTAAPNGGTLKTVTPGDGEPVSVDRKTFYGDVNRDFRKERMDMGTLRFEHDFGRSLHLRNTLRYAESKQDYIYTQPDDSKGNLYYGYVYRRPNTRISNVDYLIDQTDVYGTFMTGSVKHDFSTGLELSQEEGENDTYVVSYKGAQLSTYNTCSAAAIAAYICTTLNDPNPHDPFTGTITKANNPNNAKTVTKALYAFDTIEINPQWQANLGVRFDSYDASYIASLATNATTGLPVAGIRSAFKRHDDLFNYQAALIYKPVKAASVYVSYSTSSTPAGNSLAQGSDANAISSTSNASFAPQKDKTLEAGAKWDLLQGRMSLSSAIFEVKTQNAKITLADGSSAMVGEKRVRGYELGATGNITDKWEVFAGYTNLDAVLVHNGGSGTAYGLLDGAPFPNTAHESTSITTDYQLTSRLKIGGGAYHTSKVYGNASPTAPKWVPGYTRIDANATYTINTHLTAQLNIQNLTDAVYFTQAYATHYATIAPGRSAVLSLNFKY